MGRDSSIEWTDHTFSPWWGCVRISPACGGCVVVIGEQAHAVEIHVPVTTAKGGAA